MILRSYLITNVMRPFAGTLAFLTLLFAAWAASRLIGEGGAVSMTLEEFLKVTALRTQIALEIIRAVAAIEIVGSVRAGPPHALFFAHTIRPRSTAVT